MSRPAGTGHSGYHPPACTCISCVARRSGYKPGRRVWRGRDVTPERSGAERPPCGPRESRSWFGNEYYDEKARRWRRPGKPLKRGSGFLSGLITLLIGAVLAVLIVYPLLPEDAQAEVLQVQQKVAELAPWLESR